MNRPGFSQHFGFSFLGALLSVFFGEEPGRATLGGWARAATQLPGALKSRWRARSLAVISDTEAFERPRGAHFYDRFHAPAETPQHPSVLFVSPYPICPPTHGGGVFMYHTLRELAKITEVHALVMLDYPHERAANEELAGFCASATLHVRNSSDRPNLGSITPHAVHEFESRDMLWLIDRLVFEKRADVIQLEYTALAQYAAHYNRIVCALFEHDIYFQSIGRGLEFMRSTTSRLKARWEYLRAMRFELRMLPKLDRVQVCTRENRDYLTGFRPRLAPAIEDGLRAGISTPDYAYPGGLRVPLTMLFLGSFRHMPNQIALEWFTREVLPLIVARFARREIACGRFRPLARPRLSRSPERNSNARVCRGPAFRVRAQCGLYLPHPQRLRRASQTARSLRERHPCRLHLHRRGRFGPRRRRVLLPQLTIHRGLPNGSSSCSRTLLPDSQWQPARAPKWKRTGICGSSQPGCWKVTVPHSGQNAFTRHRTPQNQTLTEIR